MLVKKQNKEYEVREGYEWFWKTFEDGSWEPNTFRIFDRFITDKTNVLDIGAWIGPTTLYAADKARKVFAFEPDPVAHFHLELNVSMSGLIDKVWIGRLAVSNEMKNIKLGIKNAPGDSMTSILWGKSEMTIPAVPFHAALLDSGAKFVKIDIEGGEIELLENAQLILEACQPTVHLSLHTPWFSGKSLETYREVVKKAFENFPTILDENLNPTTLDAVLSITDHFTSFVATYEKNEG